MTAKVVRVRTWLGCALLAGVVCAAAEPATAGAISCGQVAQGDAELVGSCTGDVVVSGGRLNLAGHTVHGTIHCDAPSCEIVSRPHGGAVVGFGVPLSVGIVAGAGAAEGAGNLVIDGIHVQGFGTGIAARNVVLTNSRVTGCLWRGVDALESIEAVATVVRRNGDDGLHARIGAVAVDGSEVVANGGSGVRALAGVIAVDSTIALNARDGVENYSEAALIIESRVRENGRHGVRSDDSDCDPTDVLELRGSQVQANGTGGGCGAPAPCADLVACAAPSLDEASSCDKSLVMESAESETWSSCTAD
jgi:hypothetical protein